MAEIGLIKRVKYAGDVHAELLKVGWSLDTATAFVNNIPDADIAHVRHGRWRCHGDCGVTECSVCGWSIEEYVGDYDYCPNCGAKMDGGTD